MDEYRITVSSLPKFFRSKKVQEWQLRIEGQWFRLIKVRKSKETARFTIEVNGEERTETLSPWVWLEIRHKPSI